MKTTFSVLALTGALALTAIGALPASAQSGADVLNHPAAIKYSWGVIVNTNDGPMQSYTNKELDAPRSAQSQSVGQKASRVAASEAILNDPRAIEYSWGVVLNSNDGPMQSYTFQELDATRTAQSQSIGTEVSRAAAAEAILNDPRAIKYSWGVVIASNDGPMQSYTFQELNRARQELNAARAN